MKIIDSKIAHAKHWMWQRMRRALDGLGFCEITSQVRHPHGNLRECMELNLRSAMASGLSAVYEIGPCFRNDQPDATHLGEFQMLELFWDRPSFAALTKLTKDLLETAFQSSIDSFDMVDLSVLLPQRYPGFAYRMPLENLKCWAADYLCLEELRDCDCAYKVYNRLIDKLVDELHPGTVQNPAMVINYPMETVCVARPQCDHPERIERAEFFVNGLEVAHGFVDDMNVERVAGRMRENGPEFVDEQFLSLLASGVLPASSGVGFGLDRLLMVNQGLTDIRDCVHGMAA